VRPFSSLQILGGAELAKRTYLPAKLTCPRLAAVYLRTRLLRILDDAFRAPVVWVEGPPGAGKTTLALSWLKTRKRPSLWYEVDAGDSDIASFYHYLGIAAQHAAPRYKRSLPHLTPEYLGGQETFTRRYFEELFRRMPLDSVLVFDNAQDAGAESPLHDVLRVAFETVPEHVRVLCLSRTPPPAALARLRANGRIAHIDPEAMRLTLEETTGVVRLRSPGVEVQGMHERARGWAAGIVLMLEPGRPLGDSPKVPSTPQALFDYFAGEVWRTLDEAKRHVLMECALLPRMPASDIVALTGYEELDAVFAELVRRNYFTYRLSGSPPTYEFHPLFREFLSGNASAALSSADISRLRHGAAALLDASGRVDEAIALFIETADWSAAALLLIARAPSLVMEGRSGVLEEWLKKLPAGTIDTSAALVYWLGICRMPFDPVQSRGLLEKAFALFDEAGDRTGAFTSWSSIIDSFAYEWGDFKPSDAWIAAIERMLSESSALPSPEVEARVAAGMFSALMWRKPRHPDLPLWSTKVLHVVLNGSDMRLRMTLGSNLLYYYLWSDEAVQATVIMDALRPLRLSSVNDPLTQLTWHMMEAMYEWLRGDHATCVAAVDAGMQLAERMGVHLLDGFLIGMGIESAMSHGHQEVTDAYLKALAARHITRPLDRLHLLYLSAAAAWLRGDLARAVALGESAMQLAERTGYWLVEAVCALALAISLFDAGKHARAAAYLDCARESSRGQKHVEFMCLLQAARFALEGRQEANGLELLRRAMAVGAQQGYMNFTRWNAAMMSRLCAMALEHDIETDYVRRLIAFRKLAPPGDAMSDFDFWPWPIKIQTLGGFAIHRDGAPMQFTGKVQRRPLALLKTLIAFGGRKVSEARLAESLWPEAEGDTARMNLRPAIHRLRKLVGADVLHTEDGRLSIDPARCWVDTWALERRLDALSDKASPPCDPRDAYKATRQLFALYTGPFLPGDDMPEAVNLRERLGLKLIRHVLDLGEALQRAGAWPEALTLYEQSVAVDPYAEGLHRGLMQCHLALQQPAEVLRAYERCMAFLKSQFGLAPSAETRSLAERARVLS
jgi:LuxR family transcriptional regulator, maltose regulon positive regulatory protein